MLRQPTLDRLRELRLRGMAEAFASQLETSGSGHLDFEERLGLLVDAEWTHRRNTTLARLLREARLRLPACPEDVEFGAARGLTGRPGAPSLPATSPLVTRTCSSWDPPGWARPIWPAPSATPAADWG